MGPGQLLHNFLDDGPLGVPAMMIRWVYKLMAMRIVKCRVLAG